VVSVLVTGGAGFIGSNFVRYALATHADWRVTTLDKLTYAGRRENLHDVMDNPRHTFEHGDIADAPLSGPLVEQSDIVVHFAAETHVDRSIMAAGDFIRTDVEGTFVLLEAARRILDALGKPVSLIKPVADRPGHDRRYCLDTTKLRSIGWSPAEPFEEGLRRTIEWYRRNEWWWRPIKEQDPAFKAYYQAQYQHRQ
jgi:dTDP-D-glucose 4,6-dehydratase